MSEPSAVGTQHDNQLIFQAIQHAQALDDQLQEERVALPAHDPAALGGPAERACDLGEIVDVFEGFARELDGSGGHDLMVIKLARSTPIKRFVQAS